MSKRENYILLFKIYEKGLINYHQVFRDANYSIEYIVRKRRLTREYKIQIVLSIKNNPLWRLFFNEPRSVKKLIEDYSSYFSITDVRVLHPLKRYKLKEETTFKQKPLEERIFFEYYTEPSPIEI